jgi:AsmA protein
MRVLFYGLLALVCLVLAGLTFVVIAGPSDLLRDQLTDAVKARTGRDLAINGAASFTFYPNPGLAMDDVTLSDPPEMGRAPFARIARMEMTVPFSALVRRKLAVERVVLKGAVVDLRIDAAGRRNWDFAAAMPDGPAPNRRAATVSPIHLASTGGGVSLARLADATKAEPARADSTRTSLAIEEIRLINGIVRFANEASGRHEEIKNLDAQAELPPGSDKLRLNGRGTWRGEEVQVQGTAGMRTGLAETALALALKLTARPGEVSVDGVVTTGPSPQFQGKMQAATSSLRTAASWLGAALPAGPTVEAVALSGGVAAQPDQITIKDLVANVDGNTIRGNLAVAFAGAGGRPFLRGALAAENLDLNPYFGLAGEGARPAGVVRNEKAGKKTSSESSGSIGDLIETIDKQPAPASAATPSAAPPPQVRGWSSQPYNLAILQMADADLKLDIGRLTYRDFVMDRSKIAATLSEGHLKAVISDTSLYKGRGTGVFDVEAAGPVPKLALQAKIDGADTLALLKASAGFDRLTGRGVLTLTITGQGQTQQQMTESLTGTAAVSVANGAMIGFNVAGMVKQAQRGQVPQLVVNPAEKTDFTQLSGTFAIAAGVAQSQDMTLVSPALRAGGTGSFDLGKQFMDLRLKPKLAAVAQGGGGVADLANLDVPILIRGPWDAPRVTVDLNSAVKDNPQIKKGVEQIGELLKSKEGKEAAKEIGKTLRNLLGR